MSMPRYDAPRHEVILRSAQGLDLTVTYVFTRDNAGRTAVFAPTVFVEGPHDVLAPNTPVEAVLINFNRQEEVTITPLRLGWRLEHTAVFCGKVGDDVQATCEAQLAIRVGDDWQIDPAQPNEAHNFNFAWLRPTKSTTPISQYLEIV